ncbi:MAG: substrate-binding domain-containing protein, partial [Terriglobia bacterium]
FHPHLTAVAQPGKSIGYQGASLLLDRIEGKRIGDPVTIRIPPELKIRESTKGFKFSAPDRTIGPQMDANQRE